MATVRITDTAGTVLREYEVPPTERIELNPGERVVFVDTSIDDVGLQNVGDVDVALTVGNFTVVLAPLYALLEQDADVELLFSEAFDDDRDPFGTSTRSADAGERPDFDIGRIATLDTLIETEAGTQDENEENVTDDGLGNDGRVSVGDLDPGHLRAEGVEGVIPVPGFGSPEEKVLVFEPDIQPQSVTPPNDEPDARDDPDPDDPNGEPGTGDNRDCVDEAALDRGGETETPFVPVSTSGNILANDDFGADGEGAPPITQIRSDFDGVIYTDDDNDGAIIISGPDGAWTLIVTVSGEGSGDYLFTLNEPLTHTGTEADAIDLDFTYTIQDGNGDEDSAVLRICVHDDVPVANNDTDKVDEGIGNSVTGNVIAGISTNGLGAADDPGADDATVTAVDGADIGAGMTITGDYGTLTIAPDGSYTYTMTVDTVPPGEQEEFLYTLTDSDGDADTATLTITFNDGNTPAVEPATNKVEESDLPVGSTPAEDGETATGALTFSSVDPATLSVEGVAVTGPTVIAGTYGTLTINPDGSYSYTLNGPVDHSGGPVTDVFAYSVTDDDGDSASSTLTIAIVDDVPVAVDDTDRVDEGAGNTASGNVVTGVSENGTGGADTIGADTAGAGVTAIGGVGFVGSTTVAGTYGTLTIFDTGAYTYTLNVDSVPPGATESFLYTLTDGDGDSADATLTIEFNDSNEPVAKPVVDAVEESDLPGGTTPLEDGETATGTLEFASDDPATLSVEGTDITGPTEIVGDYGTLTINPDGSYSYTLSGPVDHSGGPVTDVFDYAVTDDDGDVASSTLTINIIDDDPTAANFAFAPSEGPASNINLVLVVDASGSMNERPGGPGTPTRFELLQSALTELLNEYGALAADVEVTFVVFASGSDSHGANTNTPGDTDGAFASVTMSVADAITYLAGLEAYPGSGLGQFTEYDDGLRVAQDELASIIATEPSSSDTENIVYFLSDGRPNPPENGTPDGWQEFVENNNIRAIPVGIGPDVTADDPDLVAVGNPGDVILVTDESGLSDELLATIPFPEDSIVEANVFGTDGQTLGSPDTVFGADGPATGTEHVATLVVDGVTYTYDPVLNQITPSNGDPVIAGSETTITTPLNGRLTFNFDTGDFRYVAPPVESDQIESFSYTIVDGDGDTALGTIQMAVEDTNQAPTAVDHTVWVPDDVLAAADETNPRTGFPSVDGSAGFALLLALPTDPDFDALMVSVDSIPLTGSLSYYDSTLDSFAPVTVGQELTLAEFRTLRYAPNDTAGADAVSFGYTVSDGFLVDSAIVNINTVVEEVGGGTIVTGVDTTTNTIYGTQVADMLAGGALADTILGGEGDDDLTGGNGDDIIDGGSGADTLVGGDGNDTLYSGLDSDAGDELFGGAGNDRLVLQDTSGNIDAFAIADGGVGIDILDISNGAGVSGDIDLDGTGSVLSRLTSIEIIDMTDTDGLDDVFDLTAAAVNQIGAANDLEGMAFSRDGMTETLDIDLFIRGNTHPSDPSDTFGIADDVDLAGGGWSEIGTITDPFGSGGEYGVYWNDNGNGVIDDDDAIVAIQNGLQIV